MATFTSWTATRYSGDASSRSHNVGSPSAGDKIVVFVFRGNAGTTGTQNHATSSGFTELDHVDPGGAYRMIGTVLEKTAVGTEGSITFDWTAIDGEPDQVICSVIVTGADNGSFVASLLDANSTTWTYPADTLDNSIHAGATHQDTDISSDMYPTDDTNITHSTVGWRNGGIALSGGNRPSQTFSASQGGAFGTVSFDDGATTLTSDVTTFTENEVLQPNTALGVVSASVTGGASNIKQYEYVLDDLTNTLTWNGSAWVAGAGSALLSADGLDIATPTSVAYTFTGLTDIGETVSYAVRVRAKDQSNVWGSQSTRLFSSGTWKDAANITFTALGASPPSGTITNPSDNERKTNASTAGFTITGTATSAASTVTDVDISIDGGGLLAASNTGTNFSTWSRATGALSVGAHTLDVKITDALAAETDLTQIDFVVNALPTASVSAPSAAQIFGYDTTSVNVTGNASDDLQVTAVQVRHRTDGGAWGAWLAASNTGNNYSTWAYTITGLSAGDAIDLEARSTDADTDVSTSATRSFTVNNRPVITGITSPTEGQNYTASSAHPNVVTTWSDADSDNVDQVSYTLTRNSDGFYWDGVSAWQAGAITPASSTGLNESGSYTFTDGVNNIELPADIGDGITYTFTAYISDGLNTSTGFVRIFSSGSGIPPTIEIDSHLNNEVLASTTTQITFTGTHSAGDNSVDDVEYRTKLNDAPFTTWASVTTATSPWSQVVTGLEPGDVVTFEARAVDTEGVYST